MNPSDEDRPHRRRWLGRVVAAFSLLLLVAVVAVAALNGTGDIGGEPSAAGIDVGDCVAGSEYLSFSRVVDCGDPGANAVVAGMVRTDADADDCTPPSRIGRHTEDGATLCLGPYPVELLPATPPANLAPGSCIGGAFADARPVACDSAIPWMVTSIVPAAHACPAALGLGEFLGAGGQLRYCVTYGPTRP